MATVALAWALVCCVTPVAVGARPAEDEPSLQQPAAQASDPHADHAHGDRVQDATPGETGSPQPTATQPAGTPPSELPPFIPRVTDEDRRAAFPDVDGHTAHDTHVNYFVLLDRLEWQGGDEGRVNLDTTAWVGFDRDRLWVRGDGERDGQGVHEANAQFLYGRQVSRWWDVVAGVRQDARPGAAQTWAAIGMQGLAPYWFEVEATAYVGASGRTKAVFEAEYDLRITNRWILQPLARLELSGQVDAERHEGAGLTSTNTGFRLRYLVRREFAPYVGITWDRTYGRTASFARADGRDPSGGRFVAGLRMWF